MILEVDPEIIYIIDEDNDTCLHNCIYYIASIDIIHYIVEKYTKVIMEINTSGMSPLHYISEETLLDVVTHSQKKFLV